MDFISLVKEVGLPLALVVVIGWRFLRQSEQMHKVLSEQAAEAKRDGAKQAEKFLEVIDRRDDLLRDTMENFSHLRALGKEHSGYLGRIEQDMRGKK